MQLSLSGKLFFTGLTLTVSAVVLVATLTFWSLDRGFTLYVAQAQLDRMNRLTDELIAVGSGRGLQWLAEDRDSWNGLLLRGLLPHRRLKDLEDGKAEKAEKGDRKRLPPPVARVARRLALLDPEEGYIIGAKSALESDARRAITTGDRLLGWLVLRPSDHLADGIHGRFVQAQGRNLLAIGLGTVLLAGLAALLLGRHLSRPVTAMARTAQRLSDGDYEARAAAANRSDEIGSLARDINTLAATLGAAEAGRKRWVQDTAHELRTPLSSLRAEVEALQDGIRQPDAQSLARLHAGIMTLAALIDDLRQLAEADGGRLHMDLKRGQLWPLVKRVAENLESRARAAGIEVHLRDETGGEIWLDMDQNRLAQVLRNLTSNAIAYSDAGGRLEIVLHQDLKARKLILQFDDTPPGVSPENLPNLFDRFFRVEESRNRRTGGRGLGLAICRAIVEAHGGRISAEPSPLGGLRVLLTLPLKENKKGAA